MKRSTNQQGHAGKHDEICERLSLDLKAAGVALIVIGGRYGNGMSLSLDPKGGLTGDMLHPQQFAAILRAMADQLDAGAEPAGVRTTVFEGHEPS